MHDAWVAWETALDDDPSEHDAWYGYAEFCLFLGREEDYLRARRALFAKFGTTNNPLVAERTSRTCLLRSVPGEELRRAVALAESLRAIDKPRARGITRSSNSFTAWRSTARSPGPGDLVDARGGIRRARPGPSARPRDGPARERTGRRGEEDARRGHPGSRLEGCQRERPGRLDCPCPAPEAEAMILPDLPALLDGGGKIRGRGSFNRSARVLSLTGRLSGQARREPYTVGPARASTGARSPGPGAPPPPRCLAEKGRGSRQQAAGGPSGPGPSWYGVVTA